MDRPTAIRKLHACLRLAKSAEPHEAAAALRQAQALMCEYGLTEADADAHAFSGFAAKTRYGGDGVPNHIGHLANTVAGVFGCFPVLQVKWTGTGIRSEILFVGPTSAGQICEYAFTVLRRQVERQMSRHVRRVRKAAVKRARAASFADGWVIGVASKLGRGDLSDDSKRGIDQWMAARGMETRTQTCRDLVGERFEARDQVAGFVAGTKAELHSGVGGSAPRQLEVQP